MGSKKTARQSNTASTIEQIKQDKLLQGEMQYLVQWDNGKESWVIEQIIPRRLLRQYQKNKQIQSPASNKKKKNQDDAHQDRINIQSSESKSKEKRSGRKSKRITKDKGRVRQNKRIEQNNDEEDSFMNQPEQQENEKNANQEKQGQQFLNNKEIELVAEIENSSQDDEEEQEDQQENQEQSSNQQNGGRKTKHMKQSKMKTSKHKTKAIVKQRNRLLNDLNQDNILYQTHRPLEKKNYKQQKDQKIKPAKNKINFNNVVRQFDKTEYVENLLISSVLSSGMKGPYKYYLVRLKNNQKVYVRESDMRHYFPRKLHEFYQRILNKLAKSTRHLNFAL